MLLHEGCLLGRKRIIIPFHERQKEPARDSGPLQWGPVREMMPSAYRGDYYRPPPAFRSEMDSVEWLERLEDFLCLSRVPPSDRGMAARYLLIDSEEIAGRVRTVPVRPKFGLCGELHPHLIARLVDRSVGFPVFPSLLASLFPAGFLSL
ncbi:hypothetical protein T4D_14396 [Trichinella pseudospiralis]|uniref:Uncharacterized protein n=2 Tax=Trichinella pseudospiralis TaxID=6337 RepID=A0A0V1G344_TRIPS|nr:hypothetical protein T4D_14396 [Trichinella pseudospiralis]